MAGVQDQLEIKFRLTDGTDIGPKTFPAATSVATLKENILAQWPKGTPRGMQLCKVIAFEFSVAEKENGPRTLKDVKLISAGKILENNRTVGECRSPLCDIPGGVTTMHVVVQPSSVEKGRGRHIAFHRGPKLRVWCWYKITKLSSCGFDEKQRHLNLYNRSYIRAGHSLLLSVCIPNPFGIR
ncbi:hypothetical protein SADUNF_Sadunf17G0088500 [Salix dunnii]|uniref:UBL3-like ubiquitin domain-containing protein n=1 Tax=Salix dunnii TaxID=1413687 RepID=A0A835J855_9ROSI|nr:hypothetical protein SADUNF_Sadunf17G0088500 [Salix dunnii]